MLAIVIPFYKIDYFKDTLQSICNQTDKRFKVYIGNDNSPQNPENIISEYKNSFHISYRKFNENIGRKSLPKQWMRCIDLVGDEEWIMILGDDDFLESNAVESWYKNKDPETDLYRFSTQMLYSDDNNRYSKIYNHPEYEDSVEAFYRKFKGQTRSSLSEYIFKKSIYEKYRFKLYPLGWYSDDMGWLEFSNGKPIKTINNAKVFIRVFANSISGNLTNKEEKQKADVAFYKDFCSTYLKRLPINKRVGVLRFMEKLTVEHKLFSAYHIFRLHKMFFFNLGFKAFLKLIRRRQFFIKAFTSKL